MTRAHGPLAARAVTVAAVAGLLLALSVAGASIDGLSISARAQSRDQPAQSPAAGTASVSGRVVSAGEPASPLRKARVTLNGVTTQYARTVTTDDAGAFTFAGLPAGRFHLQATKPGFLTANYGAMRPERSGTALALAAGQQAAGMTIKMARGGVISGTVLDQNGQPAEGVGVSVLRFGYFVLTGERTLGLANSGGSGTTDDRGVYRAWGLPPGEYAVLVTPNSPTRPISPATAGGIRILRPDEIQRALRGAQTPFAPPASPPLSSPPDAGAMVDYAALFAPGTFDVGQAARITLGLGEEVGGVNLRLNLTPVARVNGTATIPAALDPRSMTVTISPKTGPVMLMTSTGAARSTRLGADGTFSFAGMTPGAYTIVARPNPTASSRGTPPPTAPATSPAPGTRYWAMSDVAIEGRDVDVALDLRPSMTISGTVSFDGLATPPANAAALRIFLVPRGSGGNLGGGPEGGQVDAAGKFTFTDVTPGAYRVTYSWSLSSRSPWSVRASTANGRDVLDVPLEVRAGENVAWTIAFTDRPTEVGGRLQDTTGRPAPDYFIIVFPADRSLWRPASVRVQMTRPGDDGQFTAALPPGEYFVAALTDVENNEWFDPRFLDQLVSSAVKVTLLEGQKVRQDLVIR